MLKGGSLLTGHHYDAVGTKAALVAFLWFLVGGGGLGNLINQFLYIQFMKTSARYIFLGGELVPAESSQPSSTVTLITCVWNIGVAQR